MAHHRGINEWNHTACILAMLYNTTFGRRGAAKSPQYFHPLANEQRLTREDSVRALNEMVGVRVKS